VANSSSRPGNRPLELRAATVRERLQAEPDWGTLEAKLRGGVGPWSLAKELKQRPQFAEVNIFTLEKVLGRIKKRRILEGLPTFGRTATLIPATIKAAIEQLQGIPDVRALESLVRKQAHRVKAGITLEQHSSLLLPGVREEMELSWKMQLSVIEAKLRLGLLQREPLRLEALFQTAGPVRTTDKVTLLDPAARQRVLQALKMVRRRLFPDQVVPAQETNGASPPESSPTTHAE
jgi:hypothetical protein